jgi:two-component system NtrC family sensor kinase
MLISVGESQGKRCEKISHTSPTLTLKKLLMQPKGSQLQSLTLDPAIDSHFLTVAPNTPLLDVLTLMSRFRSCMLPDSDLGTQEIHCISQEWEEIYEVADTAAGCVLVMEESKLIGVFTERDIVMLTAKGMSLASIKIGDVVKQPAITLTQSQAHDVFIALGLFRQHRIRHLPIVDEQGIPVGIITQESIRKALQPVNLLTRLRYVKDVMTTQVIHASVTVSVLKLAQLMTEHQVSSIVICQPSGVPLESKLIPIGIVTERDIVQFQALELDLSQMLAQDVMSTPLFCLSSSDSLWLAHEHMQRHHVRRLIVSGSQGELVGIISQTSLLQALNPADMYGLIEILQQAVEERTYELKKTNEQLRCEIIERQRAELELLKSHDYLKIQVEERTAQLTQANAQLQQDILERQQVEAALRQSEEQFRKQANQLHITLQELHSYQSQLIQTEKMFALGQLVAGVAHEINNPINFIYGNIGYASQYMQEIMHLLQVYIQNYPNPVSEVQQELAKIDLNFIKTDLPKLLKSMKVGADRIRDLVLSLRNFSRLDEAEMKSVNLHEGIESTLLILQNQLKSTVGRAEIQVIKQYGNLPLVECYAGQLNQVFMNLLANAIDALEECRIVHTKLTFGTYNRPSFTPAITIHTSMCDMKIEENNPNGSSSLRPHAIISIKDNGSGMSEAVRQRLFDPFFTTKPVGKGTGLGLSISYQIVVKKHSGKINCISAPGEGTEFVIAIPIWQKNCNHGSKKG